MGGELRKNIWGDPALNKDRIPQWPLSEVDEMISELLECSIKEATKIRSEWMANGKSPRLELVNLASQLDDDT
jgi:hypothetical protein